MAKRVNKYDYDMTVRDQMPFESDIDYYKALARQANARLTRIENAASDPRYSNMSKYAYRNAQYDIHKITGSDANTRFDYNIPETKAGEINKTELHRRLNAVQKFLESPSSTKTGLKAVYEKRAQTINQKYGYYTGADGKRHKRGDWKNLTWEDMAKYYESDIAQQEDKTFGSKTELRALGAIKRVSNDPDKIRKALEGNQVLSNDAAVNAAALKMLENGLDPSEIF